MPSGSSSCRSPWAVDVEDPVWCLAVQQAVELVDLLLPTDDELRDCRHELPRFLNARFGGSKESVRS